MQVVEDEQQRLLLRHALDQLRGRVEEPKTGALGFERGWDGKVREPIPQLREELGELGSAAPSLARSASGSASAVYERSACTHGQ